MKSNLFFVVFLSFLLISCASKPEIKKTGDLCGLIVNENNQPVKDFVVTCRNEKNEFFYAVTDSRGMFLISNLNMGFFDISGEKNNYVILAEEKLSFFDRNKVFCFQINSVDGVLKNAEKMILGGQYKKALEMIQKVKYQKNSYVEDILVLYKSKLEDLIGEEDDA